MCSPASNNKRIPKRGKIIIQCWDYPPPKKRRRKTIFFINKSQNDLHIKEISQDNHMTNFLNKCFILKQFQTYRKGSGLHRFPYTPHSVTTNTIIITIQHLPKLRNQHSYIAIN